MSLISGEHFRVLVSEGEQFGPRGFVLVSSGMRAVLALRSDDLEGADEHLSRAMQVWEPAKRRISGAISTVASWLARRRGRLDEARTHAETAERLLRTSPPLLPMALASLAMVDLAESEPAGALAHTREAIAIVDDLGGVQEIETLVQRAHVEALVANGDTETARAELRRFVARLSSRAVGIRDPVLKASFLADVPDNGWLVERGRAWGVLA